MSNKKEFIPPRILLSQPTVNESSDNNDNANNSHQHANSFHGITIEPLLSSSSSLLSSLHHSATFSGSQSLKSPRRRSISTNRLSWHSISTHEPHNDTRSYSETRDTENVNAKKHRNSKDSMSRFSIFRTDDEDYLSDPDPDQQKISKRLSISKHNTKRPNLSPLLIPPSNSKNTSSLQTPRSSKSSKSGGLLPNADGPEEDDEDEDLSYFLDEALSNSAWMPTKSTLSPLKNSNTSQMSINSSSHNLRKRKKPFSSDSTNVSDIDLEEGRHSHQYKESIKLNDLSYNLPTINSVQYLGGFDSSQENTPNVNQSPLFTAATGNNLDRSEPIDLNKSKRKSVTSMSRGKTFAKAFQKISNMVNADEGNLEDNDDDRDDNDNEDGSEIDDISRDDGNTDSISNNVEMGSISSGGNDEYINMEFNTNVTDNDIESIATTFHQELENSKLHETTTTTNATVQPFNLLNPFVDGHNTEETVDNNSETVQSVQQESIYYGKSEGSLFGKSLRYFSRDSKVRKFCYILVTSSLINQFFTFLIVTQIMLLSIQQWDVKRGYIYNHGYTIFDWILLGYYVLYTIEMFMKIIAFGLYDDSQTFVALKIQKRKNLLKIYYSNWKKQIGKGTLFGSKRFYRILKKKNDNGNNEDCRFEKNPFLSNQEIFQQKIVEYDDPRETNKPIHTVTIDNPSSKSYLHRAYIRTSWNQIDFISICCFWVSFFLSINRTDIGKYQVFRSLMCLKILRMLNISNGTRRILKSLKDAALQSRQVSLFLICFWVLFGIIGVESFKSSLRRQCVWTNPSNESDTFINTFQFCGSYLDPITNKALPYINSDGTSSTRIKGFTCPVNSKCITGENPYGGSISFDNVAQSMELVFVILSANTFTDLMYYAMDSDSMVASFYFIICIFILTVWLLSLIVAVIINSYTAQAEKQKLKKEEGIEHFLKTCQHRYNNFVADSELIQQLQKFDFVFVTLILISFVHNCTKSSNMSHDSLRSYNQFDFIVSIILLIEIFIRFGAFVLVHNWRIFFYSAFNCIDLFLAISTLVITLPSTYEKMDTIAYGWYSFFSISRFYRVVKSFNFLKNAWASVFTRSKPLIELSFFGILTIYLVSIIMSRLFEGIVPESELENGDQWIMHNLPNCLISLYIITSTENWTTILYTTQEYASNTFTRFCVAVYLLMWFLFSNTVLLSIFIAIITDNMGVPEIEKRHKQIKHFYKQCVAKLKNDENQGFFDLIRYKLNKTSRLGSEFSTEEMVSRMKTLMRQNDEIVLEDDEDDEYEKSFMGAFYHWCFLRLKSIPFYEEAQIGIAYLWRKYKRKRSDSRMDTDFDGQQNSSIFINQSNNEDPNFLPNQEPNTLGTFGNYNQEHRGLLFSTLDKRKNQIDRSLYIFPNDNAIRKFCQKLVSPSSGKRVEGIAPIPWAKHLFSIIMFIASVIVVILACYVTPLYREEHNLNNGYSHWTVYQDTVFMSLFTVEFLIKIIADGLLFGSTAYSKSTWNKLDFIVLISFWVTFLSVILGNYSLLITFGALKALRGFRLLTVTKDSQHYFEIAIISGARKILTAAIISLSLLIPFSLWGLNIFSGRLSYCLDGVSNSRDCSLEYSNTVYSWEVLSPNVYTEPELHFNTFRSSIESLFEIVSLEGWTDLLANVMNVSKYGEPPKIFASPGNGVFVTIFNFVSIILILNLFISVIINNYSIQTGIAYLTEAQHGWYEVRRVLSQVKPSKRKNESELGNFQRKIYNQLIQKNGVWSKVIALLLIAHLSLLLSEVYPFNPNHESVRSGFFIITTLGLFLHMLFLQYALGTKLFYANNWNTYRILVVFISLVLSCIYQAFPAADAFTNIYKAFLVSILFFIIPEVDTLNQLLKFGSAGLPSLVSLIYTWLVLFIVFAIALNQLFGLTRLGDNTSGNLNARTVTKALIMLFRSSFGEGWNYTMIDFTVSKPYCYDAGFGKSDCGNRSIALFLFIVWNILSMYIFLNILISVVINNFSYVFHGSSPHKLLTRDEIRKFKVAWNKFDPYGSGYILVQQLQPMLSSLNGVLSYKIYGEHFSIPRITKVWITRNSDSPYDIELDFKRLDEVFALINFRKVRARKFRFNRLVLEAILTSVETENGRRIRFNDLLLQVGYYSRFRDSTCLKLEDFLKRSVLLKKINQELRNRKVYSTIQMVVTRLRFIIYVKNTNIIASIDKSGDYEKKAIKKNICVLITGKDIPFGSSDVWQQNEDPFNPFNPFNNNQLYRSVSKNSLNPFSDHNEVLNNSSRDSLSSGVAL